MKKRWLTQRRRERKLGESRVLDSTPPPEFEREISELGKLDEAARIAPGLQQNRIAIMERILHRLAEGRHEGFQAAIQNDLGLAYRQLPDGDRAANLRRAIVCFTEALRFLTAEADPQRYAATQNNLGNAYAD